MHIKSHSLQRDAASKSMGVTREIWRIWMRDALARYNANMAKNTAVCESLFNISPYSDNNALQNIMWTVIQMTPPDAYYQRITDKELIDDIGYLILHLKYQDSEVLANEAWDKLSQQLQRIDK